MNDQVAFTDAAQGPVRHDLINKTWPSCAETVMADANNCGFCGETHARQPDDGGYRNNLMATGILFIVFGSFILVGGLVGLTECSLMDTTVPMYAWSNSPRVHNFALLSVKQNGLILASIASSIGFLTIVASIFLIVLTRRPRNG